MMARDAYRDPDTSADHIHDLRLLLAYMGADDIRRASAHRRTAGEIAWHAMSGRCDDDDPRLELDGWPECACASCGCSEPATQTDDGGEPVCDACAEYAIDADGEVHCSRCDDVEEVTECCGAGGQMHSHCRLRPPQMPKSDPDGGWAVWWESTGAESHLVERYATRAAADQAVAAHDWPRPGDHTAYLCGYGIRRLADDGAWTHADDEED